MPRGPTYFSLVWPDGGTFADHGFNTPLSLRPKLKSSPGVDYEAVRAALLAALSRPEWDDGSLGPVLIRLAWHSSGTYDKHTGTGGSNGATMRHAPEIDDPDNAGLAHAQSFLEPIKAAFPSITYADLWILAAYVAVEHSGGPAIAFKAGRLDKDASAVPENGRLPNPDLGPQEAAEGSAAAAAGAEGGDPYAALAAKEAKTIKGIRETFSRMGFEDQEMVALIAGGHAYGRCHPKLSGYAGPWIEDMTHFSNEYCADLLEDAWAEVTSETEGVMEGMCPAMGKRQYNNEEGKGGQMMLVSDMALLWDPKFREHVKVYAESLDALKTDFGKAFKKLTELGCN